MDFLPIFNVVLWTIIGVVNLSRKEISKISYGLVWSLLMVHLVARCFVA
jgi:hypothetical protein